MAVFLILLFTRTIGAKPVEVYPITELVSDWLLEDETGEVSGAVRAEGYQKVFLSDTQTILQIFVAAGQDVRAGDALLSYDTTLTDLDIERAGLEIQKKELELQRAYKELSSINSLVPHSEILIEPDNSWIHYDPVPEPVKMGSGTGTEEDPFFWVVPKDAFIFSYDFFKQIIPDGMEEVYNVLLFRDENAVNGPILDDVGIHIIRDVTEDEDPEDENPEDEDPEDENPEDEDPSFLFRFFDPEIPDWVEKADIPEDPYYIDLGSDYTQEEINELRLETEHNIRNLEKKVRLASLEYEKKKTEISDSVIRATKDGKVKVARTQEEAEEDGGAVIEIFAGGGFFVDVPVGELKLSSVKEGDPATVNSYETGESAEGTVTKISTIPMENDSSGGYSGNTNVSYYPATILIPESANVREGDYVGVSFLRTEQPDDSFYIPLMFVRQDKDQSFVYCRNENGTLEKRKVTTGKILYGSYVQIREGLTRKDFIAFPYGKNTKDGAKTTEGSSADLYGY